MQFLPRSFTVVTFVFGKFKAKIHRTASNGFTESPSSIWNQSDVKSQSYWTFLQLKSAKAQGKTTSKSNHSWSAIFCVIVYYVLLIASFWNTRWYFYESSKYLTSISGTWGKNLGGQIWQEEIKIFKKVTIYTNHPSQNTFGRGTSSGGGGVTFSTYENVCISYQSFT